MRRRIAALLLVLLAPAAWAHKPSDSYLTLEAKSSGLEGRWDIALRDLDFAIGLDADGNGEITWGEVRARHREIADYATQRLALAADGRPCAIKVGAQQIDRHTDGAYSVLPLVLACEAGSEPTRLSVAYSLFAELDPQHRGLLNLRAPGLARTAVLGPQQPTLAIDLTVADRWSQFADYVREGVWHIWIGLDHILFLVSLLLPAVLLSAPEAAALRRPPPQGGARKLGAARRFLEWRAPQWLPAERARDAFWSVFGVVSAFTVAHSITLSLAVLGVIDLPSRVVESVIAASVVVAALNNLRPLVTKRLWMVAFGFGLVHGFGFATVLADLGLPRGALALALVGFNVGVELGQLAIVLVILPLAFALRRTGFYRRWVMVGGSLAIAALAAVWFVERAFEVKLLGL